MKTCLKYLLLSLFFLHSGSFYAQLSVTQGTAMGYTPLELIQTQLVGQGITISNASFNGTSTVINSDQIGYFNAANQSAYILGLSAGVLMTSGKASNAIGPNNSAGAGSATIFGADPDLNIIANATTNDKCILEFDFIPQADTLKFRYIFGSEEFYEYCNQYNDAFGFFLSGPGITGTFSNNSENIALMPGSSNYVTINNLCADPTSNWNNAGGLFFQYDGISYVFTAWHVVVPCSTYHIKLAIADAVDKQLDSGVFLEKNSFSATGLLVTNSFQTTLFGNRAVEGCSDATISFVLDQPTTIPYTVNWTVGGNAINGTDYTTIPDSVTITPGNDSAAIVIHPFLDGITEGTEYVILGIDVPSCAGSTIYYDTIPILDNTLPHVFAGNDTTSCPGDSIILIATPSGGQTPYNYQWSTGSRFARIKVAPPIGITPFIVTVSDGCLNTNKDTVVVTVDSLPRVTNTLLLSSICSGFKTNIVPTSNYSVVTFYWTATCTSPNITGYSGGSGLIINQTLYNSGLNFDTVMYFVHAVANSCAGPTVIFKVVVKPKPHVTNNPLFKSICSNFPTNIPLTSDVAGANFSWTAFSSSANISGFFADNGTLLSQILVNSGFTTETVTYKIVPLANGCNGDTSVFVVTVYPVPDAYSQPAGESLCSGGTTNLVLLSHVAGTSFTWSASSSSPNITGLSDGANDSIVQTLFNSGNTSETVTYTVLPSANNCPSGPSYMIHVTVYPVPHVTTSPLFQTICNNSSIGVNLTSTVNGSSFSWTCSPSSPNLSGFYSGNTNIINQTLINNGFTIETVTYHITPTANGCAGTVTDYVVTINPSPDLSNSPAASQVCNNTPTNQILTSNVTGTLFTWTCTPSSANVTGYYDNIIPAVLLNQTLINSGLNVETVTYHITPHANGCDGPVTDFVVTVVSSPDVYFSPPVQTICSRQLSNIQILSHVPATTFSWTTSSSSANLSGYFDDSGNLISQTVSNIGITVENVTYTVLPAAWGCPPGIPQNFMLTVNPKPVITNTVTTSSICSQMITGIVFQSSVPQSTFTWTASGSSPNVSGYSNGNGPGIYQNLTNTGFSNEIVTYKAIPVANNCNGDTVAFQVTVYPVADVYFTPPVQTICPMQFFNITNNSHVTGTTFTWTASGSSAQASGFTPGAGTDISQVLNNSGFSIETVTYHVFPTANGCPGIPANVVITIDPAPMVSLTSCNDLVTVTNAQPFRLKGGIPVGGGYSGRGVINGKFIPSLSGAGIDTIIYYYTNKFGCIQQDSMTISVLVPLPFACGNSLTDVRENSSYPTIQIGTQCWMAANLNYGSVTTSVGNQRDNCQAEKYCFNDVPANCSISGGLYQWDEIMQYDITQNIQGLCPPGWHVPGETDWTTLFAFFAGNGFAGSALKYNGYSGFNALLNGVNFKNINWNFNAFAVLFWSSTSHGSTKAWAHGMNDYNPSVSFYSSSRSNAFPVRCLKD